MPPFHMAWASSQHGGSKGVILREAGKDYAPFIHPVQIHAVSPPIPVSQGNSHKCHPHSRRGERHHLLMGRDKPLKEHMGLQTAWPFLESPSQMK